MDAQGKYQESDLPDGLAQPARRALAAAGCCRLDQVASLSEEELRQMHGIGPKTVETLRRALAQRGMTFAGEHKESGG